MRDYRFIKNYVHTMRKSILLTFFVLLPFFIGTFSMMGASVAPLGTNILTKTITFSSFISNDINHEINPITNRSIIWDVRLNLSKLGGKTDFVYFGEAPDANDGPPADSYDTVKPAAPTKNYIRAWFNDSIPSPYTELERDYRSHPSTTKVWNLSVLWVPAGGTLSATITIVWDRNLLNLSEYDQISLQNESGIQISNMKITSSYTFVCPANTPQLFTINCQIDTTPPEIINQSPVTGETSDAFTFNATVLDDITPANYLIVHVNWSHGSLFGNDTMSLSGNNYFVKTITLSNYSTSPLIYHFYANDTAKTPNVNYTTQQSATIIDDEPPLINNISGDLIIGTGDPIVLWVAGMDNIGVTSAKVLIDSIEHSMIWNNGTTRWQYQYVAPTENISNHSYMITVFDAAMNTKTSGTYLISVFDNDPPTFTNILATPVFQLINGYVNLTATITDNINLSSVTIQITGPEGFNPVNITLLGYGNNYFFNQTYLLSGIYNYTFWGNDTSDNSITSVAHQFTIFGELQITILYSGWNFISLPFNQTLSTTNLYVLYEGTDYSWSEAITQGILLPSIFDWARNGQGYTLVNSLVPGYGYWLYAYQACELWANGLTSILSTDYITSLFYHWNVLGVPINQPVNKTTLLFVYQGVEYNWTQATTNQNPTGGPLILNDIFGWDRRQPQGYFLADTLDPGLCYWMYTFYDLILKRTL